MAELMTDDERKFYRTQTELAENQIKFLKKQDEISNEQVKILNKQTEFSKFLTYATIILAIGTLINVTLEMLDFEWIKIINTTGYFSGIILALYLISFLFAIMFLFWYMFMKVIKKI